MFTNINHHKKLDILLSLIFQNEQSYDLLVLIMRVLYAFDGCQVVKTYILDENNNLQFTENPFMKDQMKGGVNSRN